MPGPGEVVQRHGYDIALKEVVRVVWLARVNLVLHLIEGEVGVVVRCTDGLVPIKLVHEERAKERRNRGSASGRRWHVLRLQTPEEEKFDEVVVQPFFDNHEPGHVPPC